MNKDTLPDKDFLDAIYRVLKDENGDVKTIVVVTKDARFMEFERVE